MGMLPPVRDYCYLPRRVEPLGRLLPPLFCATLAATVLTCRAAPSSVPIRLTAIACIDGTATCVSASLAAGGDLTAWLAGALPGEQAVNLTLRLPAATASLERGWLLDGAAFSGRVAQLSIEGSRSGKSVLRGSVELLKVSKWVTRGSDGVTTISLAENRKLTAAPWDLRRDAPSYAMLFDETGALSMARWPKSGWARLNALPGTTPRRFQLATATSDQHRRFDPNAWAWGFFRWNWYDEHIRLVPLADSELGLQLESAPLYGLTDGARLRIMNSRADLSLPREYVIDAKANAMHIMLPRAAALSALRVARLTEPVLTLRGLRAVTIRNLTLIESRGNGLAIEDCSQVSLVSVAVHDVGQHGIVVKRSSDVLISHAHIQDVGQGGVWIDGGDRRLLTAGNNRIDSSDIARVGGLINATLGAIKLSGVGNSASGNRMVAIPHIAVFFEGNDQKIANNLIDGACTQTEDAGAIYAGRDWTYRGNKVIGNTIMNIGPQGWGENLIGVYLDDMLSGTVVQDNLLLNMQRGVFIGGGRDNIVSNNLFGGVRVPLHVDDRALGWAAASVSKDGVMFERLKQVPYASARWQSAYPKLKDVLSAGAASPAGNVVRDNYAISGGADEFSAAAVANSSLAPATRLPVAAKRESSLQALLARCLTFSACRTSRP